MAGESDRKIEDVAERIIKELAHNGMTYLEAKDTIHTVAERALNSQEDFLLAAKAYGIYDPDLYKNTPEESYMERKMKGMESVFFTKDFAYAMQLLKIFIEPLDFSKPFRVEIKYNPEAKRTLVHYRMPKESLLQHISLEPDTEQD